MNEKLPFQFLSSVMESDHTGSLCDYIGKKNWSFPNRFTSQLKSNAIFSLFMVKVELSENGMKHLDDVIEMLFSYLQLSLQSLKESELLEQLYRDFVNIIKLPRYYDMPTAQSAEHFAQKLTEYPWTNEMTDEFVANAIHEAIDVLATRKFNIIVISRDELNESIEFESMDESWGLEYSTHKMPEKWISLFDNPKMFAEIALPTPNP